MISCHAIGPTASVNRLGSFVPRHLSRIDPRDRIQGARGPERTLWWAYAMWQQRQQSVPQLQVLCGVIPDAYETPPPRSKNDADG